MKKGNRAHSISRPAGSSARTHNQPDTWTKKERGPTNVGDPRLAAKQPTVYHRQFSFSSFWPRAFVVLLVCFVSLGVVLVSALSGLLDSARSGCPLLAGDEWSFSLLFRFWLCCRGFLCRVFVVCCCFPCCLVLLCCLCSGLAPRGLFSPCTALPCSARLLVLWCMLVQSVFCWSLSLGTGCICDGPVVMSCIVCFSCIVL